MSHQRSNIIVFQMPQNGAEHYLNSKIQIVDDDLTVNIGSFKR